MPNAFRQNPRSVYCIAFILGVLCAFPPSSRADDDELASELRNKVLAVHKNLSDVQSAQLDFVWVAQPGDKSLTSDDCRQLLIDHNPTEGRAELIKLVRSITAANEAEAASQFQSCRLIFDRTMGRLQTWDAEQALQEDTLVLAKSSFTFLRNERLVIDSGSHRDYLFQKVPEFFRPMTARIPGSIVWGSDFAFIQVKASDAMHETCVETETGCPMRTKSIRNREVVSSTEFHGWKQIQDKIWFPQAVARFSFHKGLLTHFSITSFQNVIFNEPLPKDTLIMRAETGTIVTDRRSWRGQDPYPLPFAIEDVRDEALWRDARQKWTNAK
jgi:hypothetical protein